MRPSSIYCFASLAFRRIATPQALLKSPFITHHEHGLREMLCQPFDYGYLEAAAANIRRH